MREYKNETKTVELITGVFCDLCGKKESNWENHHPAIGIYRKTKLTFTHALFTPDGYIHSSSTMELDFCDKCFNEIVLRRLELNPKLRKGVLNGQHIDSCSIQ